jgi:hypothetical protein
MATGKKLIQIIEQIRDMDTGSRRPNSSETRASRIKKCPLDVGFRKAKALLPRSLWLLQ